MSYCDGLIKQGLTADNCKLAVKGFERKGILINRSDIDFAKVTFGAQKNVITALPLKSGAKGYAIEQKGTSPFSGTKSSAEVGTYATGVNNDISFAILNNDVELAENFTDSLLNGEFVAVLEMKDKGNENASAFRVYGFHNGLALSAYEHDPYGDTYAGALVTLQEQAAPMTALYLGATYEAGKTLFDSLTTAKA